MRTAHLMLYVLNWYENDSVRSILDAVRQISICGDNQVHHKTSLQFRLREQLERPKADLNSWRVSTPQKKRKGWKDGGTKHLLAIILQVHQEFRKRYLVKE